MEDDGQRQPQQESSSNGDGNSLGVKLVNMGTTRLMCSCEVENKMRGLYAVATYISYNMVYVQSVHGYDTRNLQGIRRRWIVCL